MHDPVRRYTDRDPWRCPEIELPAKQCVWGIFLDSIVDGLDQSLDCIRERAISQGKYATAINSIGLCRELIKGDRFLTVRLLHHIANKVWFQHNPHRVVSA